MAAFRTYEEIVGDYKRGHLLRIEALGFMVSHATEDELVWLQQHHPDWLEKLLADVQNYPADDDDEGWSQTIEIDGGVCWVSQEALDAWRSKRPERRAATRAGVKLIRAFSNKEEPCSLS